LRISAGYFSATGQLDQEMQTYELWIANYPRDAAPHGNLGATYSSLGQYDKALAVQQQALALAPDSVSNYANLASKYLYLNRLDDAKATFDRAFQHNLDSGDLRTGIYILAFLQGDSAQMEKQVAWSLGRPGDEDSLLSLQSDTEAFYGRLRKAREFTQRAVDSAIRADSKETAAAWKVNGALREAELGDSASARRDVASALELSSGRDVDIVAALALARAGDANRARSLVEQLKKDYPAATVLQVYWLPIINAAIELSGGDSSRAITDLETAAPYELSDGASFINCLYPAYVRGLAYLRAHNGAAAAAEFQKILDHPGLMANCFVGALAHLQIARAYAIQGDPGKAKLAYQDFFASWKNADPDLSIVKEAKAEYAKLQ
jgi:tetratricopeptide (TPR) repeat protein